MVEKALLKQGLDLLKGKGNISTDTYNEMVTFVDALSNNSYRIIRYSEFNKTTSSATLTFSDTARTVTNSTGAAMYIITTALNIGTSTITNIKSISSEQDSVTFQMSTDALNWYDVDANNTYESVTGNFYLRINTATINTFENFIIMYEK